MALVKSLGIKVRRPDELEYHSPSTIQNYSRDPVITIGNKIIITNMKAEHRRKETTMYLPLALDLAQNYNGEGKTLKNLVLGTTLVVALMSAGCEKEESKKDSRLPEVRKNQCLILHPDYLNGYASLGYTLLTDMNYNGDWDVAERYHSGFTTGDGSHKLYFKKGFGPAQSITSVNTEVEFVDHEFFKPYQ